MFLAAIFLSIKKPSTMSKRAQERRTEEEPVVAKLKPAFLVSRNLSSKTIPVIGFEWYHHTARGDQELGRGSVFMRTERSVRGQSLESNSEFSRVVKEMIIQALRDGCGR